MLTSVRHMQQGKYQHTSQSEADPLLPRDESYPPSSHVSSTTGFRGAKDYAGQRHTITKESSHGKQQLGLFSAVFLIFNCIIGTGIFATPSVILRSAGSIGVALLLWVIGALLASTGTAVYIELGTGLPRSGGEKNYLKFIYRKPRLLTTCMFAAYALLTRTQAANSIVFGEYVIHAFALTPSRFNTRGVALICLTFCLFVHGIVPTLGLRLQNALGFFKLVILWAIATAGVFCLIGVPGFAVDQQYETPNNFHWQRFWDGSSQTSPNAFVMGLFNVLWSFNGYTYVNQVLSEVRDPVRTIQQAAPLAMLLSTATYLAVNIAYFAVVAKADVLDSGRITAALFFRNLFGSTTEKALSIIIAFSVLGNLLAGLFTQGRAIRELGLEGVLPYSPFFASMKPFNVPLAALFTQYLISCIFMLAPPPGDAYIFMISLSCYSIATINTVVSLGLLLLHTPLYREWGWNPPFQTPKPIIVVFFLSNVFLLILPFVPPSPGSNVYEHLPYWAHIFAAYVVSLIGFAYWYIRYKWILGCQKTENGIIEDNHNAVSRQLYFAQQAGATV